MFSTVSFVIRFGGSRCPWGQKWSAMRFSTAWLQSRTLIRFAAISKLIGGTIFFFFAFTIILPSVAAKNCRDDNVYRPSESREACTGGSKYEMIIELHINERKIQLSENNGDAIRFYSVTLWLCWYIPAKPLGAFKFSFETNWLKAFGRFAICKLKSLILDHPHNMMKMLMILMMI